MQLATVKDRAAAANQTSLSPDDLHPTWISEKQARMQSIVQLYQAAGTHLESHAATMAKMAIEELEKMAAAVGGGHAAQ